MTKRRKECTPNYKQKYWHLHCQFIEVVVLCLVSCLTSMLLKKGQQFVQRQTCIDK